MADGVVILRDGLPMTLDEIVRQLQEAQERCERLEGALRGLLREGIGADDLRLAMIAMRQSELSDEDKSMADRYGQAIRDARAALTPEPDEMTEAMQEGRV